jgi:hypothetical protein
MHTRITVNGREYQRVDEMPPEVRRQYERAMSMLADKDGNGVPDVLEGGASIASRTFDDDGNALVTTEVTRSDVVVNGRHYSRLEDVPHEMRELIRKATAGAFVPDAHRHGRALQDVPVNAGGGTGGGITIRLTWPLLFAVLTVALVGLAVAWFVSR